MINSEKNLISAEYFSSLGKEAELFFRKIKVLSLETGEILNSAFDLAFIDEGLQNLISILNELNYNIIKVSDSLKVNSGEIENQTQSLERLNSALKDSNDDFTALITEGIPNFIKNLGLSDKAIKDIIITIGGFGYALSIVFTTAAAIKTLFEGMLGGISSALADIGSAFVTVGETIVASLGPASAAFLALGAILAMFEEISLQKYNTELWEKRLRENTPLISSTQPGQDNLKYVKYDDDHNIMSFEDADKFLHLTDDETNNGLSQTTEQGIFNQGLKSKKISKSHFYNSSRFSSNLFNYEPEQFDEVRQKIKELERTETQYQDAVTKGYIGLAKIKSDLIDKLHKEIDGLEHGNNLDISGKFGDIESLAKTVKGLKNDYSFLRTGKISDALKAENRTLPSEEAALEQAFDGIKGAVSGISNIMNILQIGADTFVGKLLSGFSATLNIVDSIVAIIKSINEASSGFGILGDIFGGLLGFVPGGGAVKAIAGAGGMAHYSGMPNINSLRSMNSGRNYNPNISVMVHSEIGKQASYKVLVDGRIYEAKKADR